mgnify:CR=1 FL=1
MWLLPLVWTGLCSHTDAQVLTVPPATGLSGETIVASSPGQEVVIYHVGLLGLLNKASLEQIELQITPLTSPLVAGLSNGDIKNLHLIESTNHLYGDGDDVELNKVKGKDIVVDGGVTVITDGGSATPVGLFPLPVGELIRHYFVVAEISPSAVDGHAFRVGAAVGHITVSTPTNTGLPVWASNDDRVVIGGLVVVDPPELVAQPNSYEFDPVLVGGTDTLIVTLSNPGTVAAQISDVTVSNGEFHVTPTSFTVDPSNEQQLIVVHAPTRTGPITGQVRIDVVDLEADVTVNMSGFAASAGLTLSATSVDFGLLTYGEVGSRQIELSNLSDIPIDVTDISISDSQFSTPIVPFTLAPWQVTTMPLSIEATSLGTKTATLSIRHEGDPQPVDISLRADATIALGSVNLNFGRIPPGETALLPVTVDNPSGADVTITSITSDNPRFVPDHSTCVIPAGGSVDIMIAFTPTNFSRQEATLSITHNPTVFVGVLANPFGRGASAGVDASGNPLNTLQVPFGGEWLASILICLYALFRRRTA